MKPLLLALVLISIGCSHKEKSKPKPYALPTTIDEAVGSESRAPENRARDQYRHPAETLKFFGLEPHMTVVEIAPGNGWYTEILAPLLTEKGRYIMATPVPDKPYFQAQVDRMNAWKAQYPMVKMENAIFSPPKNIAMPADNSADMVVTFRNIHNWMSAKGEKEAFKAFFKVLKPGGILGVVEHRALPSQKDPLAKSGYVRQEDVVKMAKRAGFTLVATSEVNANPKDQKNHPMGVWTLPPSLKLGEKDRDMYLAIGESDRMTLKFMKPLK